MARRRITKREAPRGFTLIEILVAVLLLTFSLSAIMSLWSVSRRVTERSRDTAEYYAIARQEAELYRAARFGGIFNSTVFSYTTPRYTDYDQNGNPVSTPGVITALNSACTASAYYRVRSTFSLVQTGTETNGLDKLGIHVIEVFPITGHTGTPLTGTTVATTAIYRTSLFFAFVGV